MSTDAPFSDKRLSLLEQKIHAAQINILSRFKKINPDKRQSLISKLNLAVTEILGQEPLETKDQSASLANDYFDQFNWRDRLKRCGVASRRVLKTELARLGYCKTTGSASATISQHIRGARSCGLPEKIEGLIAALEREQGLSPSSPSASADIIGTSAPDQQIVATRGVPSKPDAHGSPPPP